MNKLTNQERKTKYIFSMTKKDFLKLIFTSILSQFPKKEVIRHSMERLGHFYICIFVN